MSSYSKNANARADRLAGLIVGLCATALTVAIYLGCTACTATGEPDWNKADVAAEEAIVMLDAATVTWRHRPEVAIEFQRLKQAVVLVDVAIDAILAGDPNTANLNQALDAAIALVDELSARAQDDDLRATLTSVRLLLSAVKVGVA